MGKNTPPCEHYPAWTEAKFWSFIRSGLRQKWQRWPPKYKVAKNAERPAEWTWENENGRTLNVRYEYQCSQCEEWYPRKWMEVDHIEPVGSLKRYEDLSGFVERLFVSEDKLRMVCKDCHQTITNEQRKK